MKTRTLCLLAVSLLLAMVGQPTPTDAQGERLVLAFYYAWYDMTTWQKPLPDQPAPPYVSTDPAAIERHVLWAKQAGIDALVQSWYGPQVQNNQTEPNFATLLNIAGQHGFKAAADMEVASPFIHSEAELVAALQHLLSVHANHPAYLRVGGKPVIFFWQQTRFSVQSWYSIRDQVDPQRTSIWITEGVELDYLGPFDGNHLYSVAWDPAPESVLIRWGRRVREWSGKYWVATVMPGYDDRVTGRADAFVRDRAGGDYYRRCWQGAMQSGADWVVITSFNEWMEGSQIEPSVGYGNFYLNLTREQGDLYRVSTPPTAVPPTPIPPPTDTPLPSPTPTAAMPPTIPPSPTATATPTPEPTPTSTPSPTITPSPTATATPRPSPTPSPTPSPVPTPSPTPTLIEQVSGGVSAYPGLVAAGLALFLFLAMSVRRLWR